ncbi:hypothetical protein LWC34_31315 [Kibdelosporangium philippinense]|uniref:Uncharacterized protein n=1 Tax=Kibdelosporangium philippinense TaxID=211113 RepID=A0ABS8ZHJ0_9PSEU|nr:hypothetical protein [Kibdelosporangium philippinense]MCE7007279.1 hypothetical protein [Kibdelosporangium philippinense]
MTVRSPHAASTEVEVVGSRRWPEVSDADEAVIGLSVDQSSPVCCLGNSVGSAVVQSERVWRSPARSTASAVAAAAADRAVQPVLSARADLATLLLSGRAALGSIIRP